MNKKIASIFLISLFVLATVPAAFADDDRSYFISPVDLFLEVKENGLLKVSEAYDYHFDGQYNGVYRDIPLQKGQSIKNLNVSADGAYTKISTTVEDDNYHIKVYLYSDPGLTKKISRSADVTIYYEYDFVNAVKVYNDVAELQFKLWGEDWDVAANRLTAEIEFPDDDKIEYWINPLSAEANVTQNGDTVIVESKYVPSSTYLEFRGIIPLSEFNDPVDAKEIDRDGYDEIIKVQKDYENGENLKNTVLTIIPILIIISFAFPVYIYFKYGREPEIMYDAPYEHELPSKEDPLFVNAMFSSKGNTGYIHDDGIQAVIMELIKDKVIKIADKEEQSEDIKLILPASYDNLPEYKRRVVKDLLAPFADGNNVVDFAKMKDKLSNEYTAKSFNKSLRSIKDDYRKMEIDPILRQYFDNTGYNYQLYYCLAMGAISFVMFLLTLFVFMPVNTLLLALFFALFIIFIAIALIPNRVMGRWSNEGYTEYKKWKAFEKYIKDFSLIKEHPPESVAIWDDFIIYATALGDAKAVRKAMDALGPAVESTTSDLYYYHHFGGSMVFASAVSASSSSDGVSGAGGGSGGGGGGAF